MNRAVRPKPPARRDAPNARRAPSEAVVRLRKILDLELRRGCDDHAVIGGLDQFLRIAAQDRDVASILEATPLEDGYAGLDVPHRKRWLQQVIEGKPAPAPKKTASRAKAGTKAPAAPVAPPETPVDAPVTVVKGVKEALQAKLVKLGVRTVRDLLYLFPNRHNDYADIRPIADLRIDEEQTTLVNVWSAAVVRLGRRSGTQATVGDETGTMRVVWFNQPWLADQLKTNDRIVLSGKVSLFNRQKSMESPEWERFSGDDLTHTGRLVPVYPLTQGLYQRQVRRIVKEAVDRFAPLIDDPLPPDLRQRHELMPLRQALQQIHYPESAEKHELARRRLAFEELLCVQLTVLERRLAWEEGRAPAFAPDESLDRYRASLPFALTGAQERVLGEILHDIQTTRPMARLLQGDVGSGKTAVAAAALVTAAANGYQGALMAPTEILAEQHYRTLSSLLDSLAINGRPLRVEMLVGSMTSATKRRLAEAVGAGEIDVIVGTHALIQEGVSFQRLGLAVVDEQHRFGVMQRAALRERAANGGQETPHLLVMSATPIPRTLALTLFGDLDVSVIDEMPPGRQPVKTSWVPPEERMQAYGFVREQVAAGRQAFVVCPLIDESVAVQSRAATQEYERLSTQVFPSLRLGLLHGRMPSAEKDAVLAAFRGRRLDILVATTVIEVGIDIPNATVMVIEGADRFGLAQLHQLRGRVGRGGGESYCLLLSDDPSYTAQQRLKLLEDTSDGFALAEADLRLRGPGDYFGTRQSGMPELQAADFSDTGLIEQARQEALALLRTDPQLASAEHAPLKAAVHRMSRVVTGEVS